MKSDTELKSFGCVKGQKVRLGLGTRLQILSQIAYLSRLFLKKVVPEACRSSPVVPKISLIYRPVNFCFLIDISPVLVFHVLFSLDCRLGLNLFEDERGSWYIRPCLPHLYLSYRPLRGYLYHLLFQLPVSLVTCHEVVLGCTGAPSCTLLDSFAKCLFCAL